MWGHWAKTRQFSSSRGERQETTGRTPTFLKGETPGVQKHQGGQVAKARGHMEDKVTDHAGIRGHGKESGFHSEGKG